MNKFKCPKCPKLLYSKPHLDRHLKCVHPVDKKPFICDFDGKQFSTKDLLRIHMQSHGSKVLTCSACMKCYVSMRTFKKHLKSHVDKFNCNQCEAIFAHKSLLINHIESIHEQNAFYKCFYCTREFKSKSARSSHHVVAHKNKSTELIFKCDKCKISFETKEDLRIHSFIHFDGEIHTCPFCDQIFKSNRFLEVHLQKHSTEKKFSCEVCGQKFTFMSGLRKHKRLNRCKGFNLEEVKENEEEIAALAINQLYEIGYLKDKNLKIFKSEKIEDPVNIDVKPKRPQKTYICDRCGIEFKFRKKIELHMKEKHVNQKYQCNHCVESFKSRQKYLNHLKDVHGIKSRVAKEIFSCDKCDRKFDMKSIFEAHMASHLEVRSQICSSCGMAFKSVSNLRRHEASVHASTRNEVCEHCQKTFKTKNSLKIHQQTVHVDMKVYVNCIYCNVIILEKNYKPHLHNIHSEEGKVKNFECELCPKVFRNEYLLRRHFDNVHVPVDRGITYNCKNCEFTTIRLRDLKDHELNKHFSGIIFACECGKRFKSRKLLLIHMACHNENVEYKCEYCETSYKTRSGLRKHTAKYHQNIESEIIVEKYEQI